MRLLIFAVACLASVALIEVEASQVKLAPRLGHFSEAPFLDLYLLWTQTFEAKLYERDPDDLERFRPSGGTCLATLQEFQASKYKVENVYDFVPVDACLGYIYDGAYKEDFEKEKWGHVLDEFEKFGKDKTFWDLYNRTKIDEFTVKQRNCLGNLYAREMQLVNQYKGQVCNHHYIQNYLQFAECADKTGLYGSYWKDPYVDITLNILSGRVKLCFGEELKNIGNDIANRASGIVLSTGAKISRAAGQRNEREWTRDIQQLFHMISGTSGKANHRAAMQYLSSVPTSRNDDIKLNQMMEHVSKYATNKISSKTIQKYGAKFAYRDMVDQMCKNFRRSNEEDGKYDYALAFTRLVELHRYLKMFHIDQDDYIKQLLKYPEGPEGAAYLCVAACNLLSATDARYVSTSRKNGKFEVTFDKNKQGFIAWPMLPYV